MFERTSPQPGSEDCGTLSTPPSRCFCPVSGFGADEAEQQEQVRVRPDGSEGAHCGHRRGTQSGCSHGRTWVEILDTHPLCAVPAHFRACFLDLPINFPSLSRPFHKSFSALGNWSWFQLLAFKNPDSTDPLIQADQPES